MQRLSVAKSVKAMATEAVAVHRQKQSVREELSRLQQFESEAEDVNDNFSKWMEKVLAQSDAYVVKFAQVISLKHPAEVLPDGTAHAFLTAFRGFLSARTLVGTVVEVPEPFSSAKDLDSFLTTRSQLLSLQDLAVFDVLQEGLHAKAKAYIEAGEAAVDVFFDKSDEAIHHLEKFNERHSLHEALIKNWQVDRMQELWNGDTAKDHESAVGAISEVVGSLVVGATHML